ncbi:hypothetical protein [Flavobacterium anhuiense]|uniref:hypothetical protein n=1 Tax=Flavobacterium anhuiense TaxID=459526 RepID=UPI003D995012
MKYLSLLFLSVILVGCNKPKVFILNDTGKNRYYVSEFINTAFEDNQLENSPVIVIDGIPFRYNKNEDTIRLPLKKADITSLNFLNQNSSRIIYNEKENDGAVIISTKNQTQNP